MMQRRCFLAGAGALATGPALPLAAQPVPSLLDEARRLAMSPFKERTVALPPPFAGLNYNAYRGIRPIPGRAAMLPLGSDFAFDLLPPGHYFPDPVRIELEEEDGVRDVPFSTDLFSYDERYFDAVPANAPGAGFSGLRLRYPLNVPEQLDEVLVVQGASYFRAIGEAMVYGLSARAVAIGTGGAAREEFPRFTRLRLHRPENGTVRLEGVLDSPSLAGHLEMVMRPGAETEMDIAITLLPRRDIGDIGIAPLTSMYLKGPIRSAVSDDFRPRVHDSDVLAIENGAGEKLWRCISNPARVETSAFLDEDPRAFGLYQSARKFSDYEDTEARYHERPNAVVRPSGNWGRGSVMLVEIPTSDEFMDNIVAFWRPRAPLVGRQEYRFAYGLTWTTAPADQGVASRILQSRSGREHDRPGTRRYVVDVAGAPEGLLPDISVSDASAEVSGVSLFALPIEAGSRITFLLAPGDAEAVDIRLVLRDPGGAPVGPVWLHRWTRARDGGV